MIIASIVLYNHSQKELLPTLQSLEVSPNIEKIILVDNSGNCDWVKQLKYSKITYLKSKGNFGFGYGHNQAIRQYAVHSRFFLICNPDIYFDQAQFSQFIQYIETRPEGLFLPKIVYEDGENQYGARLLPTPLDLFARRFSRHLAQKLDRRYLLKYVNMQHSVFVPYLSGCFMLFRSESLLALDGFDERFFMYMEDVDISRRCAEKFGTLYCPQFSIVHLHEQASYKNIKLLKAHLRSAIVYFNKWGWIYDPIRRRLNEKCLHSLDYN
ncbi:glycosyltransferase family 2 protein [Acinetobacter ursingii]|uniref:glycosyltransferase family 2 protein n=1 Tax=Acinetobacter ursingii TaxID=108980 RepID=UPI0032B474FD